MYNLQVIKETLSEKQFTQLAINNVNNKFIVSVYFRHAHIFKSIEYEKYSDAIKLYIRMIQE